MIRSSLLAASKSEKQTKGPISSALHCFSLKKILKFLTRISLAWSHVVDIFNYEIKKFANSLNMLECMNLIHMGIFNFEFT